MKTLCHVIILLIVVAVAVCIFLAIWNSDLPMWLKWLLLR
jgi:hypothetical protein